jgi:von Willebrand factor A domain-containing protein 8
VASLTVQQNVIDGKLVSTPSPLVTAAKEGHVLVIDEADKAPTEVVAVLKGLIDSDMLLPDGRRLLSQDHMDRLR